jgi:hypothetical protein
VNVQRQPLHFDRLAHQQDVRQIVFS